MATPARTVQLRDIPDVLTAYTNWNTPQFAIWSGKQMLFTYDDEDASVEDGQQLLHQWLEWIQKSNSAGIYTLAIYKNQKKEITNNTPYNGSVNFQLNAYQYNTQSGTIGQVGDPAVKMLVDEVRAMRLELNAIKNDTDNDDDDDNSDNVLGQITTLLSNPLVGAIITAIMPNAKVPQQVKSPTSTTMQTVSGTATKIAGTSDQTDDDKRIANAMVALKENVPNLPAVLEQLSLLAIKHPSQMQLYVSALMGMNLK